MRLANILVKLAKLVTYYKLGRLLMEPELVKYLQYVSGGWGRGEGEEEGRGEENEVI